MATKRIRVTQNAPHRARLASLRSAADGTTLAALTVLGLVISLAVRGHFVMPHPDFLEFADVGHALIHGHLPPTFKRAPVYPLVVSAIGALLPVEAPERAAAEWLNVAAYPLSGLLVYLIASRWIGRGARWIAMAALLMPIGVYCTAHVIVEPLLTTLLLATVWFVVRDRARTAYVLAGLASVTRFDAAGLLLGLTIADIARGVRVGTIVKRLLPAAAPLAAWLILTAATWESRSDDHYLRQIAARPVFQPGWALGIVGWSIGDPFALRLPGVLAALTPALAGCLVALLWVGVALGAVELLRTRDAGGAVALVTVGAYVAVHAVFPFRPERFGYPPAPLVLMTAGVGWQRLVSWCRASTAGATLLRAGRIVAATAVAGLVFREVESVAEQVGLSSIPAIIPLALLAAAMIWAAPRLRGRVSGLLELAACFVLIATQLRCAALLMGSGRDLANQVEAARWVREHAPRGSAVLSACPGLLRLYVGRDPPDRFEHFGRIRADEWADILAECRARSIEYIIWHDQLWQEHGPYYSEKWRLSRFDRLAAPNPADGVIAERYFPRHPNLVIVRILPDDAAP